MVLAMQYLQPTKLIWDRTVMFVLLGISLWFIALFMLAIDLEASAAALFLFGLAMMWPAIFYGRRGTARFSGWYQSLKILLGSWY